MPIAGQKPTADPVIKVELPRIEPENYKSIIYDDNNTPLQSLIVFVDGTAWTLDSLFTQVLSKHNDLRDIDPGQAAGYQQYQEFKNFELRVTQPLTTEYDEENGLSTVTGAANVYPFMRVNKGDAFVVDTADNKKAIFRITTANRLTFNRDSAWVITYNLIDYVDNKPEVFKDLKDKTIRTYYFSKARLLEGLQPFIKSEEYENISNLRTVYEDLVRYYFANIFNPNYMTLVMPGQTFPIYDSHLANFFSKIVSTEDAPQVKMMKLVPVDNEPYLTQPQFWKMMMDRDHDMRNQCNKVMGLVSRDMFNRNTYLQGVRYSNIRYLVYPETPDLSLNVSPAPCVKLLAMQEIIETQSFKNQEYSDVDNTFVMGDKSYDIIKEVLADDYYVLSADFYNNTDEQSLLEILVKDYLKGQALNLKQLYAVCNVFKKWKRLEQYYYGPIILTLLKEANRAQYT